MSLREIYDEHEKKSKKYRRDKFIVFTEYAGDSDEEQELSEIHHYSNGFINIDDREYNNSPRIGVPIEIQKFNETSTYTNIHYPFSHDYDRKFVDSPTFDEIKIGFPYEKNIQNNNILNIYSLHKFKHNFTRNLQTIFLERKKFDSITDIIKKKIKG